MSNDLPSALSGLSPREVEASRTLHGANRLPSQVSPVSAIFLRVLKEPMLLLLFVACSVYLISGQLQEGILMLVAILFVAGISIFQEVRSDRAVRALREISKPKATVLRSGSEMVLDPEELVVGDIIRLMEGEQVPADAHCLLMNDFSVDESLLTGESVAVVKSIDSSEIFLGTTVVRGSATARVCAVGGSSKIGKLGLSLLSIVPEKTTLQKQVDHFVKWMAFFGFLAFLFVWGYHYYLTSDLIHGLFHGLTLAMSVIPEEIPVAVSTFLALGALRLIHKKVLARHPQTVEALGAATVVCVDKTGTITRNKMTLASGYSWPSGIIHQYSSSESNTSAKELLFIARLACEPVTFDPMEQAIVEASARMLVETSRYELIHEYPLGGRFPMMTHVYSDESSTCLIATKGAPEGVLSLCGLSKVDRLEIDKVIDGFTTQGYRVLAVADGALPNVKPFPDQQASLSLRFVGLIALLDPVKDHIPEVLEDLRKAGITVKMITGDYPITASSIARQAGFQRPDKYLTGDEVHAMSPEALSQAVRETDVFARAMPETKLKLIEALKRNGEVVAMTGDGVNDAPALKAAHIGVAMGKHGTEVARQSAALVLMDDDLAGMTQAVEIGRNIYDNLKKAIRYIISIHIPIVSVVLFPLLFGWEYVSIFTPVHIIFLELLMGPTCSIVYENEPPEPDIMLRAPRPFSAFFFSRGELAIGLFQGMVVAAVLLMQIYYYIHVQAGEEAARTMTFVTLIMANMMLTLTGRSKDRSVFTTIRYKNWMLPTVLFFTLLLTACIIYWQPLREVFLLRSPHSGDLLACFLLAFFSVMWTEFGKRR